MAYGVSVFAATMASAGTLTAQVDVGGSWLYMYLEIPTMTSNTAMFIQGSSTDTGTFRRVQQFSVNSATVANNDYTIASATTNKIVPIPAGIRFLKVETTATVDSGQTFKIICCGS